MKTQEDKKLDLDQFPDLKAARDRYERLGGMLSAAQKDYDSAVDELNKASASQSSNGQRQLRAASMTSAGEGSVAVIEAVSASALREKIGELGEEIKTLQEALRQQRQIVDQLQQKASLSICQSVKPDYEAIITRIADALVALGNVVDEEFAFREKLHEQGIQFTLKPIMLHGMRISGRDMNDTTASRAMKEILENYPGCTNWKSKRNQ